ncbi:hypothetical protein HP10700_08771 [Helicobacter pylori 10700]|nr:hypothetical protein HP10700_08771 [Helicobacter pylori 10700]
MKEILNTLYHQKDLNDEEVKSYSLLLLTKSKPSATWGHFMRFKNQGREL